MAKAKFDSHQFIYALTQLTPGDPTVTNSSGSVLAAKALRTGSGISAMCRYLNWVMADTQMPSAAPTSVGKALNATVDKLMHFIMVYTSTQQPVNVACMQTYT